MEMPVPDHRIISRRREIARALRRLLPADAVIDRAAESNRCRVSIWRGVRVAGPRVAIILAVRRRRMAAH